MFEPSKPEDFQVNMNGKDINVEELDDNSVTLEEYKTVRANTDGFTVLYSKLNDEALAYAVENALANCSPPSSSTYEGLLHYHLIPLLLKRIKSQSPQLKRYPYSSLDVKRAGTSITELDDLSARATTCLYHSGIRTIEDLCEKTEEDLCKVRNLDSRSLENTKESLAKKGLFLKLTLVKINEESELNEVSQVQLQLMKHMLGLDVKKKPFRNYAYFYEPQTDFEDMVNKKLAIKKDGEKEGHIVYVLTKEGVEKTCGKLVSDKIYNSIT